MSANNDAHDVDSEQRIDKWLWAARFFKTRSAAAQAVSGGKIDVDGERVKPARRVRSGMLLRIRRDVIEYEVQVQGTCAQRRPANEASGLYTETQRSIDTRNEEKARLAQAEHRRQSRLGRPDKRARREIVRFKNR
ncbi:MAG: ribosome-associated heat shock protein Hsp15 [Gammaproteobacteria bacterium]|jgi:ribosome-associated heat shock protein Hsp15